MTLPDHFHELAKRVSNWGRWGNDDERGTLNLIDAEAVRRGAACVRTGATFEIVCSGLKAQIARWTVCESVSTGREERTSSVANVQPRWFSDA